MTKTARVGRPAKHTSFLKHETERVEKALAKAQATFGTAYHFTVMVAEKQKCDLAIRRTDRGTADAAHFLIYVNPFETQETKFADLVRLCSHEVIHAILFPVSELAEAGKTGTALEEAVNATETATYTLQRAMCGEVKVGA